MPHHVVADALDVVCIQPGAIVSKVIYRDETLNVTVFGFDAGEGLTEHQAGATAIVQVLTGRLRFTADGEELDAGPGYWLHLAPGTPHALVAREPTVMLLTLVPSSSRTQRPDRLAGSQSPAPAAVAAKPDTVFTHTERNPHHD